MKTELLEAAYTSFDQAKEGTAIAMRTYNHLRPHNSTGNLTPFEVHSLNGATKPKRLWKHYYKPK